MKTKQKTIKLQPVNFLPDDLLLLFAFLIQEIAKDDFLLASEIMAHELGKIHDMAIYYNAVCERTCNRTFISDEDTAYKLGFDLTEVRI